MKRPIWLRRPSGFKLTDLAGGELLWFHDFTQVPRQDILRPIVGQPGTFDQPTSRAYFDEAGNYRTAAAGELIWSKSPSGRILPVVWPAYTNEVTNNQNGNTLTKARGTWGNSVSWNGFNLYKFINDGSGEAYVYYTVPVNTGDVVCASIVCKPLLGQTEIDATCWLVGGTSTENPQVTIPLDGSEPVLPAEGAQMKPLMAGALPLPNGYYYIWYSIYVKDKQDHTSIRPVFFSVDQNGDGTTGDGTTPYWLFGAHNIFKNIIYPPAPVLTSGSTVTVSQDQLTFPFDVPYPAEGLTFALEFERPILSENLPPYDGLGKQFYIIGVVYSSDAPKYSPLGITTSSFEEAFLRIDGGAPTSLTNEKSMQIGAKYSTSSIVNINIRTSEMATASTTASPGDPADPSEIRFRVNRYGPIWLKRYAIFKGIVDPALLL